MLRNFSAAALLLTAVILVGCAGSDALLRPPQAEIDKFLAANPDLPPTDLRCVNDGTFEMGMLASTVRFLLGDPPIVERVKQPWAQQEHWKYGKRSGKGKVRIFYIEDGHVVGIDER